MEKIIIGFLIVLLISIAILLLYPTLNKLLQDNFTNASGYGMNNNFNKISTLIGLNKVTQSMDFKLFSLMSQLRFSLVKPPNTFEITGTDKGIITRTPLKNANVILFPGLSDYILRQNNREVWPRQYEKIDNNKSAIVYNNNNGHFNTITTLLETLNYKDSDRLNTIRYDFRKLKRSDILQLFNKFMTYLKDNTVIIAYDFGCVIANILINLIADKTIKDKINKFILICPTIGGTPMTIRDYFSSSVIDSSIIENYDSVLMSMPNQTFYNNPVVIYNSVSYDAKNLFNLMKSQNKPYETYSELLQLQNLSLNNPGVDCIVISSEQFDTPVTYNFRNNMNSLPERYLPINNNQTPNSDIHNNGTVEGLQSKGDRIVPISSINKLKELWGDNIISVELIKDKDHFTILKSYELALIIISNL